LEQILYGVLKKMKIFKDAIGREWKIIVTLGAAMDIKERFNLDLLRPEEGDPPQLTRLATDEYLLAEIIAALLADQFAEKNITARDVFRNFDADTMASAHKAFYEELVDFFRKTARADRAEAVIKQAEMIDLGIEVAVGRIREVDSQAAVDEAMSGLTFGKSQAASQSTRAP